MVQKAPRIKSTLIEKVQTALLSIATTAIVACGGFMFKVNAALSRIEQSQSEEVIHRGQQDAKLNAVQLDVVDLKIATTELRAKQNQKPQ